jgi:hypothetical protein
MGFKKRTLERLSSHQMPRATPMSTRPFVVRLGFQARFEKEVIFIARFARRVQLIL